MRVIIRFWLPILFITLLAVLLIILVQTGDPAQMPMINLFKEPIIALSSVILTLVGVYATSHFQSQTQREKEKQETRKLIAQEYRNYLKYLLTIGQHYELVENNEQLKKALSGKAGLFRISPDVICDMIQKMPPARDLSSIDNKQTKQAVDNAIDIAFGFVLDVQSGKSVDYEQTRKAYINALRCLDKYEFR